VPEWKVWNIEAVKENGKRDKVALYSKILK
jgi:hypothetical protein